MSDTNRKLCALDKIIDVNILTTGNSNIIYSRPNRLQSGELGMTIAANIEYDSNSAVVPCDLSFLAEVIKDLCIKKGYPTDFIKQYYSIDDVLNSSDFALSSAEKAYSNLIREISNDYPMYNANKVSDALQLRTAQVGILLQTFADLTDYIEKNSLDKDSKYVHSVSSSYYDGSTTSTFIIEDSYNACRESLRKCCELVYDTEKTQDVEQRRTL